MGLLDALERRVRLAPGRAVEAASDIDIFAGDMTMEGVGPVGMVMNGQARRAARGDRGQHGQGGRPIGSKRVAEPARRDGDQSQRGGRSGRDRRDRGSGDAQDEGRRQEEKGKRAGSQKPGAPAARALCVSRASSRRWLRILIPRGMARSSGLKPGLCRGAIVGWAGFLTPRKK